MVTEKARELAKLVNEKPLENLYAHGDLMKELKENCSPTLEEFLELAGSLVYRPVDYFEAIIRPTKGEL